MRLCFSISRAAMGIHTVWIRDSYYGNRD